MLERIWNSLLERSISHVYSLVLAGLISTVHDEKLGLFWNIWTIWIEYISLYHYTYSYNKTLNLKILLQSIKSLTFKILYS